uniref:Uncharacterized protein n=1 Tax=Anguilla anguilla TaxID=7936 RepID=A0A0E9X633_ANGAN
MNVMFLVNINLVKELFPCIKLLLCKYVLISRTFYCESHFKKEKKKKAVVNFGVLASISCR